MWLIATMIEIETTTGTEIETGGMIATVTATTGATLIATVTGGSTGDTTMIADTCVATAAGMAIAGCTGTAVSGFTKDQ
jgi:hypothetical protein